MNLLTSSRMKDARACARLHRYRYIDGYRPARTDEALSLGTLVHKGLEEWWRSTARGEERLAEMLAGLPTDGDAFELARARAMLVGYHHRWDAEEFETLGVEIQFEAPLRNPETGAPSRTFRLAGKVDAIARDSRGRVLLVEHKTSSEDVSPGSDYWKRLRLDGQISTYYAGGKVLGHEVDACLYDVLGKPAIRPYQATPLEKRRTNKDGSLHASTRLTDETPAEFEARCMEALAAEPMRFYSRGEVVRLSDELREAALDAWQLGDQLREQARTGCHPRNPDACVRYNRTCAFFDVCTGAASLDDPSRFVRLPTMHPELDTPNPQEAA